MASKPAKVSSKAPADSLRAHRYRLRFETQAWEEWKKLDGAPKAALREALIKRLDQPHIPAAALKGELAGCYKIKLLKAGYRLVYEVLDDVVVVLVLAVGKRADSAAYTEAIERVTSGARDAAAKALRLVKPKNTQAKKSTRRAM
jgi:mRNA interferase RelE/StbE